MRPDGLLEMWDERFLPGYTELAVQVDPRTGVPYRQRRDRGARLQDLFTMIREGLQDYQGYFIKEEPWIGTFPFARYINQGDIVKNISTGDTYTVKDLLYEPDDSFLGKVRLIGGTDPGEFDRLRLDPKNAIVYGRAHPRSEAETSNYDADSERTDRPATFNDTIEYSVRRSEPGTVGKRPFDRERQALPLLREDNLDEDVDPAYGVSTYGWWFDHIIQFDIYARTHDRLFGNPDLGGGGDYGMLTWFQDFMMRNRWVYLWNGINQLLEWQGTEDKPAAGIRNDMVHVPLLFYVRTERISFARTRRIEQIDVLVSISAPSELSEQTGCPVPTGQTDITLSDFGLYTPLGGS